MAPFPRLPLLAGLVAGLLVAASCSDGSRAQLEARYADGADPTDASTSATLPPPGDDAGDDDDAAGPTSTVPAETTAPREVSVFDLEVGLCFDDPDDTAAVESVPAVDCATLHDNEVYHLFDLTDGAYPGDEIVGDAATDGCLLAFGGFVGSDYLDSALEFFYLTPTSVTWQGGDREVVCILYRLDFAPMTGTMRGSGI